MTFQNSVSGGFSAGRSHRWNFFLLLLLLLAGAATEAWSATIRGTVQGPRGPIPAAQVTLLQDGRELAVVTADQQGGFLFDRLNPGRYHLQAVLAPYLPSIQEVTLGEEDRRVVVRLGALNESVSITARRSPARP